MKRKSARAYLDGFGDGQKSVLDLDAHTMQEVVEALDLDREDPFVNPWKRGHKAAIRSILCVAEVRARRRSTWRS